MKWTIACMISVAMCAVGPVSAAPVDGTFSYQGRLTNSGSPITGLADLTFSLWNADVGGAQIGADTILLNVSVADGLFNVELDYGVAALDGEERWLEIEVRSPAGVGGYTTLAKRQPILGTPYAIQTRGIFVDGALDVGVGTITPDAKLHVGGPTASLFVRDQAQGSFVRLDGTGALQAVSVYQSSGDLGQELIRADRGGMYRSYNDANSTVGAAIGTGTGSGFVELYNPSGFLHVRLYADKDFDEFNGVEESLLELFSQGPGGVGGEASIRNNSGRETVEILGGGSSAGSTLSMLEPTVGNNTVFLQSSAFLGGGSIATSSAVGDLQFSVEADADGSGAFLALRRNSASLGLIFDGNDTGTGDSQLSISGASRNINFQTRFAGDDSVGLPTDAIQRAEIRDEPGVASNHDFSTAIGGVGITTLISRSITVPASGYVLVLAQGDLLVSHVLGTTSDYVYGVSAAAGVLPSDQDIQTRLVAACPSGGYDFSASAHGLFPVASAGTNTYYFNGREFDGSGATMYDLQLTLVYFPTSYGVVSPTLLNRDNGGNDQNAPGAPGLTAADIKAEQMQAVAFDQNRRAAEAADYAQRFAELEARIRDLEAQQGLNDRPPRRATPAFKESDVQAGAVLGQGATGSR